MTMTDLQLFEKYQKQLVWFINTKIGRWFFKVDEEIKNICNVAPNALTYGKHYERQENGEWREVKTTCFRTNNKYARLLNYRLAPLHKLAYLLPSLLKPEFSPFLVPVMLTVTDFYPGATGAGDPIDSAVYRNYDNSTFSALVSGNGNSNYPSYCAALNSYSQADKFSFLMRGIFCFKTDALGGDDIESATFSLYGKAKATYLGNDSLHICQSNPASTTAIANSDYEGMASYTTSFGNVTSADFSITGYNDISLNAAGLANINTTGISKFGTKLGWDINGSFTGTFVNNSLTSFTPYWSNNEGTSNDPKLTVTHSVLVTFSPQLMMCS